MTTLAHYGVGGTVPQLQARVVRQGRTHWRFRRHNEIHGIKTSVQSTAVVRNDYAGRFDAVMDAAIRDLTDMYENPSDPNATPQEERAHAAVHLARSYFGKQEFVKSLNWARLARALLEDDSSPGARAKVALAVMREAWALLFTDGVEACEKFCREWDEKFEGQCAELNYLIGSTRLAKSYQGALAPGRFALVEQRCLAFVRYYPRAVKLLGFPVEIQTGSDEE